MMRGVKGLFLVINLNLEKINQGGTQLLKKVENGTPHKKRLGNTGLDRVSTTGADAVMQ